MKKNVRQTFSILLILLLFSSCKNNDDNNKITQTVIQANEIVYTPSPLGRYPENFDFDETRNKFVVGSNWGTIGLVDENGNYEEFITETPSNPDLVASWGITVDEKRNRIIIIYLSPLAAQTTLGIYKLSDGSLLKYQPIDMSALTMGQYTRSAGENIEIDEMGNLYMSDGYSPVIVKLDLNYNPSIFLSKSELATTANNPGQFSGGPMEIRGNRMFLWANNDAPTGPKMYITSMTNPEIDFKEVIVNGNLPKGVDGNAFMTDTEVWLTGNSDKFVKKITTTDNWTTAQVSSELFDLSQTIFPTEIRKVGGDAFVIAGESTHLLSRFQMGEDVSKPSAADIKEFKIYKIIF